MIIKQLSCEVQQPNITPVSSGRYRLEELYFYEWEYNDREYRLSIPKGYIYDGASIPRWAWSILGIGRDGLHRAASLVHDYLYYYDGKMPVGSLSVKEKDNWTPVLWPRPFTRKQADKMFCRILRETEPPVKPWKRKVMFWAVRLFGWQYWRH